MQFEYFRGNEAEQFMFYRIPQMLITDKRFKKVSSDAKLLYGLLLDRIGLSYQNPDRFVDDSGRTFIYFTRETTMELLNCGKEKAAAIFQELEKVGLIERKRQGLGKPTKIYVKNFTASKDSRDSMPKKDKSDVQRSEKPTSASRETATSRGRESRLLEDGNTDTNQTNINQTNLNHTEISQSVNMEIFNNSKNQRPIDEMKKPTFPEVLEEIGNGRLPASFLSAKKEKDFCGLNEEERFCRQCTIPYWFKGQKTAMKYALEYLFTYSWYYTNSIISDEETQRSQRLMNQVIDCLADMTMNDTYQVQGITVKYYEIIDRLNAVNQEDSLLNWFTSFESEWKKILASNTITYEKAYMKSCIWNWLNEYKFSEDNTIRQLDYELKIRDFQAAI